MIGLKAGGPPVPIIFAGSCACDGASSSSARSSGTGSGTMETVVGLAGAGCSNGSWIVVGVTVCLHIVLQALAVTSYHHSALEYTKKALHADLENAAKERTRRYPRTRCS